MSSSMISIGKRLTKKAIENSISSGCSCKGAVVDHRVIDGPDGPEGFDFDSVFRSLAGRGFH